MIFPKPILHPMGTVEDRMLKYAVICSRYQGKWIFCRHKDRETWELPGGHIEAGETALEAALRELYEETGTLEANIIPVGIYRLFDYGLLCFAEVKKLSKIPETSEIGKIQFYDQAPSQLTYAGVHDQLLTWVKIWLVNQPAV